MLLATKILALVLICAGTDGAVQHKSYQQAGVGSAAKVQRGLTGDSVQMEDVKAGHRQTLGYNYPGGNSYNYVAVGADGAAEVAFKLDLSLFLERLNAIPNLQQVVVGLVQKIDTLIYYVQGGGGGGGGGGGLLSQIIALERSILARFERQDEKINALYQLMQRSQGELGRTSQEINQILMILQRISRGDSGGSCAQEMGVIQSLIQQMMKVLTRILEIVEQSAQGPGASTTILDIVQKTYMLLQQFTTVIEQIRQQVHRGSTCSQPGGQGSATEIQILQEMSTVMGLIENIPQKILIALQNSGLLGGSNGPLIQYLQQIIQICESVRNEIITVRNNSGESIQELRRYFAESQKSLVAVKKVVTETTELVQSSAAAAISASRSLKCPSKNQKPDLDDP